MFIFKKYEMFNNWFARYEYRLYNRYIVMSYFQASLKTVSIL